MMPIARPVLIAFAVAALAACSTTAAPPMSDPNPPSDGTASCNAAPAQTMVGQVATAANVEQARTLAGARIARIIKPGMMVTMEYIEGRLNIDVDEKNVMTHIRCG
ncbi:I78 family peptidase inhibitor [Lysobacter humi (ex Lee et al. 2017)]